MKLEDLFSSIESTLLSRFKESGFIQHSGDKGENREEILIEFLRNHLPKRYGITKGEIITHKGERSHAIDIIIYDAVNCPVLYAGKTSILPIEGVYGIIEVKSTLSKAEFIDASSKIESFKKLAPRELGIIAARDSVTLHRPSRPFGIVLGYQLSSNSLESLKDNWQEQCNQVYDVNYFTNLVCVLGEGLLHYEQCNLSKGEKELLLDTDEFVNLVLTAHKRHDNGEQSDEIILRIINEAVKDRTFGRFVTYLLIMLTKMKLNVPDLTRYIDPELPMAVVKE
ncbi:hypothetical protein RAL01_004133 [Vibrio vulnificus]|uniref:DUF6602 domain-containing protein n=1 Tax=Gammaproteobacteria TaxID=1236 RepID=UPI00287C1ADA|nr:DUF6602 domain-containing protein [Vibrio parahaemolyticus]EHU5129696.1 hypothetical protein [Vibrio vulnificus]EJN6713624.1 hypothetical protein [Vibrio vulnificus]ELG4951829.1 hypothetical protein [Vibrio vulnificus]WMO01727.1 hypothetical protein NI379_06500 [Vibrio parahaemolyticus]